MKEYNQLIIGNQIKKYRTAKKLTQKELAEKVGLSTSYVSGLEHGDGTKGSSISMTNICKIAEILNVSLDDLAGSNIESNLNNNFISLCKKEMESMSSESLELLNELFSILIEDK